MVHLDVKKVGRIPDGGGWRIHGRDSDQRRAVDRAKTAGANRGYVYLHSIIDGFSRLAHTEHLPNEQGATAAAFLARAKVWFTADGITHIHRVVTDNGACYRSGDFARIVGTTTRHQMTKPFTPRHNGKVERYQRILAVPRLLPHPQLDQRRRTLTGDRDRALDSRPQQKGAMTGSSSRVNTRVIPPHVAHKV